MSLPSASLISWLEFIVLFAAAVAAIWGFITHVIPWYTGTFRPVMRGLLAVQHLPTVVAAAGRIETIEKAQEEIRKEVKPNGSSSLRDAVDRTEKTIRGVAAGLEVLTGVVRSNADNDPMVARFECNHDGENIWVSKTYCRLLNRNEEELLGRRYLSVIPAKDRERVRAEFESCRDENRAYYMEHHLTHSDGREVFVATTADPVLGEDDTVVRWVGSIRVLQTQAAFYSGGYANGP